jgi:phospholipid/cholesterol/gamma-HCH transport system permease protein
VGLRTHGGTEGVGRSTTQAVVSSSILVIATDFFLNNLIIYLSPYLNL